MLQNQHREFDPESTSLARLKERRDELKAAGVKTGVVAKLSRLINRAERPVVVPKGWKPPERWSPKPSELAGPARKLRPPKEQKPTGKLKASQRGQMQRR